MQTREARIGTVDPEARTVELVWSTGARVRRMDWWTGKRYEEELSLDPAHVDMARLQSGSAPLLNAHGMYDLSDVLGVVEKGATVDGSEGRAVVRFSRREEVDPIFRDVQDGIIRNVSVGYNVRKFEITEEEGKLPIYRAVDWEPWEISLVAVGADAGAGTRAAKTAAIPCTFVNRAQPATRSSDMGDEVQPGTGTAPAAAPATPASPAAGAPETRAPAAPVVTPPAAAPAASAVAEFRKVCKAFGIPETRALDAIQAGQTIEQFRNAVIDERAAAADATASRNTIEVGSDHSTEKRAAIEAALLHRFDPVAYKLEGGAREYRGMSLLQIGTELVEARGIKTRGLGRDETAGLILGLDRRGGMMTTSDFPGILANVANKTLRRAYEAAPQTFKVFSRQVTLADFKEHTAVQLGDAPKLEKVNEHGEFKRGAIGEGKESYKLETFGKVVAITRQVIINDDLSAFTRIPALFGTAAANLESDTVWGIVIANAPMGDGQPLFSAAHGNLANPGSPIGTDSLGAGRAAMRQQKSLGGTFINVQAQYLMVPTAKETEAEKYMASSMIIAAKAADFNPFQGKFQIVPEPRLDADSTTSWYLSASPDQIDTIEYAYLDGQQGVFLESRVGFDVDGVEIKARMDFAAKAIDWRGLYKNPGA
ncbi:MAG: prohead protease/major capsid protein fusion protein [Inquilinus sp.]